MINYSYQLEGKKIYFSIFRSDIPLQVLDRYAQAAFLMDNQNPMPISEQYLNIIYNCPDLEALEVVSRSLQRNERLVRKFLLMVYIGEMHPNNNILFVKNKDQFICSLGLIILAIIRFYYKLIIGFFLIWKYTDA